MSLRELHRQLDARATADPDRFGFGYQDGQHPWAFNPAIEQARETLVDFFAELHRRGMPRSVLQIGLGRHGGMHHAFRRFADHVVTVEIDERRVADYRENNPIDPEGDVFVVGDSSDSRIANAVGVGFDLLFLDGASTFEEVSREWELYAPLVRPGGTIAIVDGSQDLPEHRHPFDIDRLVLEIERQWLRPRGVPMQRSGFERRICHYVQPDDGEVGHALVRPDGFVGTVAAEVVGDTGSFRLYACGEDWIAIPQEHRAFDRKELVRGEVAVALRADSHEQLRSLVEDFERAVPLLDEARSMLAAKRPGDALRIAQDVATRMPTLRDSLVEALAICPWSGAILRALGTLALAGERVREAAALLRRAVDYDLGDQQLLLALAQLHLSLMDDQDGARTLLEEIKARVRQVRLQSTCHRELEGNVLWSYPKLLEDVHGVLQVGAHRGEEVAAFAMLEIPIQLYIEPHPEAFAALEARCEEFGSGAIRTVHAAVGARNEERTLHVGSDSAASSLLPLRAGYALDMRQTRVSVTTLDDLARQGAFDPTDYNLLFVDAEGSELEVLRGAVDVLRHIDVICIGVFYEPVYDGAPMPDEIRSFLLELDDPFYLRAHEPGEDPRRGNALFRRARSRRWR